MSDHEEMDGLVEESDHDGYSWDHDDVTIKALYREVSGVLADLGQAWSTKIVLCCACSWLM